MRSTQCSRPPKQKPVQSVNGYYQLTGVVSHLGGSANSGHYISDILHASGNWFCCNDSQVSMSNEATVLRTRARSAYMLFYMFRAREREAPAHRA
ncbi:uncharacterized protein LOC135536957 [Oncorhynchus masou masou]|uniref:uncharacterized protein LOC135536957 n=1 Tax=Oncorhynchus masou masou TaxID=90313 RepID=UPI00318446AF